MKSIRRTRRSVGVVCAVRAAMLTTSIALCAPNASAEEPLHEINIPSGDLSAALRTLGTVSSMQIVFSPTAVHGRRTEGLHGLLSVTQALDALLGNTRLTYRITATNVILIMEATRAHPAGTAAIGPAASVGPPDNAMRAIREEIIVTATKRLENIQEVPASLLVVTNRAMERSNVRDFDDLVKVAPSVTITKTSQPANNSINIRGIGTYAFSIATEPSVAVVIDEVPQAFQAAAFSALVDVQQVEVLRGPQNTLFGKAASAGVVSITTQPASDVFTARADVVWTDDSEQRVQGTISGPLSDTFKFRLTGNYSDYRGNVYNLGTGSWLNGQQDTTVRGKLVWEPSDDWTITLSPFFTRTDASCCAGAEYFVTPGTTTGAAQTGPSRIPMSQFLAGITPGPDNRRTRTDVDARGDAEDYGSGLRVLKKLGDHTFTSISSYGRYRLWDLQDTDSTDVDFSQYQPISPSGGSANGGSFDIKSTTQELRLTSPERRLRYVAGVFYSDTRSQRYFVRGSNTLEDYNDTSQTPTAPPSNLPTTNSTTYAAYLSQARATNTAVYGQGTFGITCNLDLIAGLRVNREQISYTFQDLVNGVTFGKPACSGDTPSGVRIHTCNHDTSVTGRAGFQYRFTPDLMAFATYSRGYKGMAYDLTSTLTSRNPVASGPSAGLPLADVIAGNQPVAPETVNSYELGFKRSFFEHRLVWNLTAFYMDFQGFQAQSRDQLLNQNLLNSIGQVTSRGVETELALSVGRFSLSGSGAYNRATMDEFPNASCFPRQTAAEGCVNRVQDLSGKPLPNTPEWSFNVNAQHDIPVSAAHTAFINANYRWQSQVHFSLLQDPDSIQSAYGIANLAAGLKTERWKLTAFVDNVFDESYALTRGRDFHLNVPAGGNAINWKPARGSRLYYGIRASVSF